MSAAEMNKLKSKRKKIRSSLTRFKTFVSNVDLENDSSVDEMKERVDRYVPLLSEFEDIHFQIQMVTTDLSEI